jgi:hypothetical protein
MEAVKVAPLPFLNKEKNSNHRVFNCQVKKEIEPRALIEDHLQIKDQALKI